MKYIYKNLTCLLIGIVLLLHACDLERYPLDEFADDIFWTNEENALLALTGIYKSDITFNAPEYEPSGWWTYGGLIFLEFATDNAYDRRGTNSNFQRMTNGTLLANNDYIKKYWANSYTKISRCNRFLAGINQMEGSADLVARLKAEARFLRATQYFYLSQFFHEVPLVTEVLTWQEANEVKKSSQDDIIQFIISEFEEVAAILPRFKDITPDETGRANKQAALAFLGRTYLATKKYAKAIQVYEEIMQYRDNSVDPDYVSIFLPANENSNENIFSMQYLQDLAGNGMPQHAYPVKDGGWCIINLTAGLFEAYEFIDGSPFSYDSPLYNPDKLGENRDPRLDYTLLYNGSTFRGEVYDCHPDSPSADKVAGGQTTQTGFLMREFFDESYSGNLNSYGANIPIIRYAEILLSYLEAKLENGENITQELLDQTINLVRGRPSVNMPPVTSTNPDELRTILRNERRVELAMEGIRYWNLLRWEIAHEQLNGEVYGAPFPHAQRTNLNSTGEVDAYGRWYVDHRAFRKDQDYKWPIPQSEQDINPNLR